MVLQFAMRPGGIVGKNIFTVVFLLVLSGYSHAQAPAQDKESQVGRFGDSLAAENVDFSDAERLLWLTDHLENITSEQSIRYKFIRTGTMEEEFADDVKINIVALHDDGTKTVNMIFLSGEREKKDAVYPENVRGVRGNPVIGMYMQGDVHEMNRLTDGSWRYFHRRIKLALADNAKIENIKVDYGGKQVEAKLVAIKPYINDPRQDRYPPGFAKKLYQFVFSDSVPGKLYSIRTMVPAVEDSGSTVLPQLEEVLIIEN